MGTERRKRIWIFAALLCCAALIFAAVRHRAAEQQGGMTEGAAERGSAAGAAEDQLPEEAGSALTSEAGTAEAEDAFSAQDLLERSAELSSRYRNFGTGRRQKGSKKQRDSYGPGVPGGVREPEPVQDDLVWIASDTHYYPPELTDYGSAFRARLDRDDGKDVKNIDRITDLWIDEVLRARPATVVLTGDLVLDRETAGHRRLAEKLRRLTEDGIRVLVIPGNHDIGCDFWASSYFGIHQKPVETPMRAEQFLELYHEFGYDQASASDADSLSYLYKVDQKHWFLMLDSAIYEPVNRVAGRIKETTLRWMEEILQAAEQEGAQVIPFAHHNLMDESRLYRTDCTLDNNHEVIAVLEKYQVPLWVSGHLHLQRIRQYQPEPGAEKKDRITEIVSGCFSMYPFPYGELRLSEAEALDYQQRTVALPEALREEGMDEFRGVIMRQIEAKVRGIPDYIKNNMAESYASLLGAYVAGEVVDETEFRSELGYRMMLRYLDGTGIMKNVEWMLADTKKDQRSLHLSAD